MQEIFSIAYGVILVISIIFLLLLARQKPSREQQIMQLVATFIMLMMLEYWLRINGDSMDELVMAQRLVYFSGCFIYYYMFLFFLKYCYVDIPAYCQNFLNIVNFIMMAFTITFDRHKLLYRSYEVKIQDVM